MTTSYQQPPVYEAARVGEIARTYLANDRATDVLGWRPEVDIRTGILRTVDWARNVSLVASKS